MTILTKPNSEPPPVSFRPEQPADEHFLFELYAGTRAAELALINWDEPMRLAFLKQQFNAMRQGYRTMFPAAEFSIIEIANQPVGRLVVNRGPTEIRLVDVALLPTAQNLGIGTFLVREICAKADLPVRLCVVKNNRAAQWYARLGFKKTGEQGVHDELEWRPKTDAVNPTTPPG